MRLGVTGDANLWHRPAESRPGVEEFSRGHVGTNRRLVVTANDKDLADVVLLESACYLGQMCKSANGTSRDVGNDAKALSREDFRGLQGGLEPLAGEQVTVTVAPRGRSGICGASPCEGKTSKRGLASRFPMIGGPGRSSMYYYYQI